MVPSIILALGGAMGIGGALILRSKGRSVLGGFALGFLLGPVGLIIAVGLKNEQATNAGVALPPGEHPPTGT